MGASAFSTAKQAQQLAGCFEIIHSKWQEHTPTDSHLWEIAQNRMTCDILETDVMHIGAFFASADALSQQAEIFLIAEYIALLRQHFTPSAHSRKLETQTESIGKALIAHPAFTPNRPMRIYAPLCYRIAQFSAINGYISPETLAVLKECLLEIAYHFTLRDGNITPDEDLRIKEFHAALST